MLIRIPCQECDGAGRLTCDGAHNPYARIWLCDECDGSGQARCSECANEAVDAWIEGRHVTPLCERHMALWKEDAAA